MMFAIFLLNFFSCIYTKSIKVYLNVPLGKDYANILARKYDLRDAETESSYFTVKYVEANNVFPLIVTLLKQNLFVKRVHIQLSLIRDKRNIDKTLRTDLSLKSDELRLSKNMLFNDAYWPLMWYLNPEYPMASLMNISGSWIQGFTGKGIVAAVIDDGIEKNNLELAQNFDAFASYDFNNNRQDPTPSYDITNINKHGTRCAGQISAVANNGFCGIGVAFESKIGGIKILDGDITDVLEKNALAFRNNYIDIYSASWGPRDSGEYVDGPGVFAAEAIKLAATYGRKGKGSIFIWAAGNGGIHEDHCSCDGYTSSPYTISVNSVDYNGEAPPYSEPCPSILTSAFSNAVDGPSLFSSMITCDLRNTCTMSHSGTSASAPLLAGIVALMLQANPNLTWRDVQHILVKSSKWQYLKGVWRKNGAGYFYNDYFGFGLIHSSTATNYARIWRNVPEAHTCVVVTYFDRRNIKSKSSLHAETCVSACKNSQGEINHLEHVEAILSIEAPRRGDLQIFLTSPSGTNVTLLNYRRFDKSLSGFSQWSFMSVQTWGENPAGCWKLQINYRGQESAWLTFYSLKFHGTV